MMVQQTDLYIMECGIVHLKSTKPKGYVVFIRELFQMCGEPDFPGAFTSFCEFKQCNV